MTTSRNSDVQRLATAGSFSPRSHLLNDEPADNANIPEDNRNELSRTDRVSRSGGS